MFRAVGQGRVFRAGLVKQLLLAATVAITSPSALLAQTTTDPATLHIGTGQGTSCVTGGCFQFNSGYTGSGNQEVNGISGSTFDVYQQSNGNPGTLSSPLMILMAVPEISANALAAGTLSTSEFYSSASTTPVGAGTSLGFTTNLSLYGLSQNTTTGYVGQMSSGDIYSYLASQSTKAGIYSGADSSINFTNMTGGDGVLGVTGVSDYEIYAFGVDTSSTGFGPNDLVDVTLGANIPLGTYIAGFGIVGTGTSNPNPYVTAMTNAGVCTTNSCGATIGGGSTNPVPEPASLALLGSALAGLSFVVRRKRH